MSLEEGSARAWLLLVVLVVLTGLTLFMFDLPRPLSDDMAPSVRAGDVLLACRVCGAPERGDLVLFSPPDNGPLQLRRVAAVPGDRVSVHGGVTYVNGTPLPAGDVTNEELSLDGKPRRVQRAEEHAGRHRYPVIRDAGVNPRSDRPEVTLVDAYFLLADRRTLVRDSRVYGPVPRASVRSVVLRTLNGPRRGPVP